MYWELIGFHRTGVLTADWLSWDRCVLLTADWLSQNRCLDSWLAVMGQVCPVDSWLAVMGQVQGMYRLCKVIQFKIQISQAWKVMESGLDPGYSYKINRPNGCRIFDPCTLYMFPAFIYIITVYCQTWFSMHGSTTLSLNTVKFQLIEICIIFGKRYW